MQKMESLLYKQLKVVLTRYLISLSDSENLQCKQPLILLETWKGDFLILNFKTFCKRFKELLKVTNSTEENFLTATVDWLRFKWESIMIQPWTELDMIRLIPMQLLKALVLLERPLQVKQAPSFRWPNWMKLSCVLTPQERIWEHYRTVCNQQAIR